MALSENELKLAQRFIGKISFKESDYIDNPQVILDVNDFGMIEKTRLNEDIFIIPRNESYYANQYERSILDEMLTDFKPTGRFFKEKYSFNPAFELFENGNISLVLDDYNHISIKKKSDIEYLTVDEAAAINISDEMRNNIQKYENSINTLIEDYKTQLGASKENVFIKTMEKHAYNLALLTLDENKYGIRDAEEDFAVVDAFYTKLKSNLSKEELKEEEKLYKEIYDEKVADIKQKIAKDKQFSERSLQKEKDRVLSRQPLVEKFSPLKGKLLFNSSSVSNFVIIDYIDENGYIEKDFDNNNIFIHSLAEDYDRLDSLRVFENEFAKKDFSGKVFTRQYWGPSIQLYRNSDFTLSLNFLDNDSNSFTLSINKNKEFDERRKPAKNILLKSNQIDIIERLSSLEAITTYLKVEEARKFSTNKIEDFLIDTLATKQAENNGLKKLLDLDSDYVKSLKDQVVQAYSKAYIKDEGLNPEQIKEFNERIEIYAKNKVKDYLKNKEQEKINRNNIKIKKEREIEETVAERLKQDAYEKEIAPEYPSTLGNGFDYDNEYYHKWGNLNPNARKSHREKIQITDNIVEMLATLSEGNFGAAKVLTEILTNGVDKNMPEKEKTEKQFKNLMTILSLDDMNIRGSQIWILFKDIGKVDIDNLNNGENKEKFLDMLKKIFDRDLKIVNDLNEICHDYKMKNKAVVSGASRIINNGYDASSLYFDDIENEDDTENS